MDDNLEAKPGEPILPKWNSLVRWIRRQRVQAPGAQISYTSSGARVLFQPQDYEQVIRFEVSLAKTDPPEVTVGEGTINGIVPKVNGISITGDATNPPPTIPLLASSGNENSVQFVCIETTHKPNGDVQTATIVPKLLSDIPGGLRADFASGGKGYIPIAVVRSDPETGKISSVYQHSVHNLQCRMYPSSSGPRVIYWAA